MQHPAPPSLSSQALKKYMAITKHFDDFQEDQFDFHGYCIRKVWKGKGVDE